LFFSSRRRHTRFSRDWSSDVCSSDLIDNWSVEKIRRIGGDAVKVLAWYRPDASEDVIAHQQAFVRAVGAECRRYDIPYVLELLEIGRASCRDRVYVPVPDGSVVDRA